MWVCAFNAAFSIFERILDVYVIPHFSASFQLFFSHQFKLLETLCIPVQCGSKSAEDLYGNMMWVRLPPLPSLSQEWSLMMQKDGGDVYTFVCSLCAGGLNSILVGVTLFFCLSFFFFFLYLIQGLFSIIDLFLVVKRVVRGVNRCDLD